MVKPQYKVGTSIYGRTDHIGDNMPNQMVLIQIESARYDSHYGHWIYAGFVENTDGDSTTVEIYDHDVINKVK